MSSLSKEQKDLILDFYFRCGTDEDINRGRDLIAASSEAAVLYSDLEDTLTDLDSIKYEPCPDNLVDVTVARLKLAAASGNTTLDGLLKEEQEKNIITAPAPNSSGPMWRNYLQVFAIAATFLIVTSIGYPVFSNMRYKSWQAACVRNMSNVSAGLISFANDNQGQLPYVPLKAGSQWDRVGYQGPENNSNTRHYYLLVKLGYVKPVDFTCPGHKDSISPDLSEKDLSNMNDFLSARAISFSSPLMCDKLQHRNLSGDVVVMADANPIFRQAPQQTNMRSYQGVGKIGITEQLAKMMSPNHSGRGQNVLRFDGSVKFIRVRLVNGDDIYLLKGVDEYSGKEVPIQNDIFVVP